MSLDEFSGIVERALFLDREDPVAAWGGLRRFQGELIERLDAARARSASRPTAPT